jgi:hypothetical protein
MSLGSKDRPRSKQIATAPLTQLYTIGDKLKIFCKTNGLVAMKSISVPSPTPARMQNTTNNGVLSASLCDTELAMN